jgi:hypothetical protein
LVDDCVAHEEVIVETVTSFDAPGSVNDDEDDDFSVVDMFYEASKDAAVSEIAKLHAATLARLKAQKEGEPPEYELVFDDDFYDCEQSNMEDPKVSAGRV